MSHKKIASCCNHACCITTQYINQLCCVTLFLHIIYDVKSHLDCIAQSLLLTGQQSTVSCHIMCHAMSNCIVSHFFTKLKSEQSFFVGIFCNCHFWFKWTMFWISDILLHLSTGHLSNHPKKQQYSLHKLDVWVTNLLESLGTAFPAFFLLTMETKTVFPFTQTISHFTSNHKNRPQAFITSWYSTGLCLHVNCFRHFFCFFVNWFKILSCSWKVHERILRI